MRIRQMGFSSRLKAHKHSLTLETLKFIVEYLEDQNATQAALNQIETQMDLCREILGFDQI